MSKSINFKQNDLLLIKMQENPDIARGFIKENKDKISEFWKQTTFELNSAGPPIKNEFEWKKAWTDQKRYIRKKAAQNKMEQRGTGGGPCRIQKFSPHEEAIFELVGMKEAVDGVSFSQAFGLNRPEKRSSKNVEEEPNIELLVEENESGEVLLQSDQDEQPTTSASSNKNAKRRRIGVMSSQDLIMKELHLQETLCSKVDDAISMMKKHHEDTHNCFKKIYRSLDSLNERKKEELKEEKRHNMEMEKYRKTEIENMLEKSRKMIELEEIKLEIMREERKNN